ncbi:MAG TPA: hypothetical protein VIJ67_01885, partial [Pseudolabrys sp.]
LYPPPAVAALKTGPVGPGTVFDGGLLGQHLPRVDIPDSCGLRTTIYPQLLIWIKRLNQA